MNCEESNAKAFPFNNMIDVMLDADMRKDTAKIVNEVINDRFRINLLINSRAAGNAP
jgi:hypothetical protein